MAKLAIKWFQVMILASGLMLAECGWSDDAPTASDTKRPGYGAVLGDVFISRPLTLIATIAGAAIFVVTVPVTALTGTIGEAGHTLVVDPALDTFYRCLGCTEVGWRKLPQKEALDP